MRLISLFTSFFLIALLATSCSRGAHRDYRWKSERPIYTSGLVEFLVHPNQQDAQLYVVPIVFPEADGIGIAELDRDGQPTLLASSRLPLRGMSLTLLCQWYWEWQFRYMKPSNEMRFFIEMEPAMDAPEP